MWIPRRGYIELDDSDTTVYVALRPDEVRLVVRALNWAEEDPDISLADAAWYETAASLLVQETRGGRLGVDPTTLIEVATDD